MKVERSTISTRRKAEDIIKTADEDSEDVDFSEVEFTSRAAADEIIVCAQNYDVKVHNVQYPIDEMMRIIVDTKSIEEYTDGNICPSETEQTEN